MTRDELKMQLAQIIHASWTAPGSRPEQEDFSGAEDVIATLRSFPPAELMGAVYGRVLAFGGVLQVGARQQAVGLN